MAARGWTADAWRSLWRSAAQIRLKPTAYCALRVTNALCFVHLFLDKVATLSYVEGPSMLPTMEANGELILELKCTNVNKLKRGDLVTYISPIDPTRPVCKRITGLPGDVVCVDPTGVYAPSTEHVVVPRNHLWVTGDNLSWSRDSREYGPLPMGLVRGRLTFRILPLRRAGRLPNTFEYIDQSIGWSMYSITHTLSRPTPSN